jgi:ketosteroid isomerase-like protein
MGDNVERVRRLIAAIDDLPAALELLDPEVEWIPRRAQTEGVYRGHEGIRKFYDDTWSSFDVFEPNWEVEELPDGRVLAWGSIRVRGKGSGAQTQVPVGGLFELRDGRISRWEDFGSKESALAALNG